MTKRLDNHKNTLKQIPEQNKDLLAVKLTRKIMRSFNEIGKKYGDEKEMEYMMDWVSKH